MLDMDHVTEITEIIKIFFSCFSLPNEMRCRSETLWS